MKKTYFRLDWLMWFAAFQHPYQNEWLIRFAIKLLENDRDVSDLISSNPFIDDVDGPKFVRIQFYRYEYCPIFGEEWRKGNWWCRKKLKSNYWPPMDIRDLKRRLRS